MFFTFGILSVGKIHVFLLKLPMFINKQLGCQYVINLIKTKNTKWATSITISLSTNIGKCDTINIPNNPKSNAI